MDKFLRFNKNEVASQYDKEAIHDKMMEQKVIFPWAIILSVINLVLYNTAGTILGLTAILDTVWSILNTVVFAMIYLFSRKLATAENSYIFDLLYVLPFCSSLIWSMTMLYSLEGMVLFSMKFGYSICLAFIFIINPYAKMIYFTTTFVYILWNVNQTQITVFYIMFAYQVAILWVYCYISEYVKRKSFLKKYKELKVGDTLKFILNEIPESIFIVDKDLKPKFVNNFVTKIFNEQKNIDVIEMLKKISEMSFRNEHSTSQQTFIDNSLNMNLTKIDNQILSETSELNLNRHHDHIQNIPTNFDTLNKELSLYDLCVQTQDNLYKILMKMKHENIRECLVIDSKYKKHSTASPVSIEIKISLTTFYEEECIIFILRDTTQRDVIARLADNNSYKEHLLASVSHELRTPLNGTINFVESVLNDDNTPPEIKGKLLPAFRSGKLMLHIINDFLDFSQINAQKLRVVFSRKSLRQTLSDCVQLFELPTMQKKIELRCDIDDDVPEYFSTDHNRLTQITINLLNNALKFTFHGCIKLTASRVNDNVEISVSDTGIGIKESDQKNLFTAFGKIDLGQDMHINSGGVGLGLVIANKLAKLLGPESGNGINFTSKQNVGTTFSFGISQKWNMSQCEIMIPQDSIIRADSPKDNKIGLRSPSELSIPIQASTMSKNDLAITPTNLRDLRPKEATYKILISNSADDEDMDEHADERAPSKSTIHNVYTTGTSRRSPHKWICSLKSDFSEPVPECSKRSSFCTLAKKECNCPRILVVDDDCFNIMAMQSLLKSTNLKCDTSYHGQDAVDKILNRINIKCSTNCVPFQLVFMDCNMPIMDGFEAIKMLGEKLSSSARSEMKVIGCTAYTSEDKVRECIDSGMDDMISKPLSRQRLEEILSKYFKDK